MKKNTTQEETKPNREEIEQPITPEEQKPAGILFDSINYYKNEDLDLFISSLTYEQAVYCIVQACKSAYSRNAYTMTESEVLSKAMRILGQK